MYSVSTEYKEQSARSLRNFSHVRAFLYVTDPDAVDTNTMTTPTDELHYSNLEDTDLSLDTQPKYATLEHNRFILDGAGILPPTDIEPVTYYQGFVSDEISNSARTFTVDPIIEIDFGALYQFVGLSFKFDTVNKDFPTELHVVGYNGVTVVFEEDMFPTSELYAYEEFVPATGYLDSMVITFKETALPYRRLLIESIFFGLIKNFNGDVITGFTWGRELDLLSSKLPKNEFKFTSIDLEKLYDPDNSSGIWEFIEKRQKAIFDIGYELDGGDIEWLTAGYTYTDGDIKVESKGSISSVTLSFKSYFNQLTDVFYKGVYSALGRTYYDLIEDVFASVGFTDYNIDTDLATMSTVLPIPELPVNEAIQLIANATRSIVYTDRYGIVQIKRLPATVQDFKFDFGNMLTVPKVSKVPLLYSVDTNYLTAIVDVALSDLNTLDIDYASATTIRISHDEATDLVFTPTGVTISGTPEHYATSSVITVSGTGSLLLQGKKINKTKTGISYIVNDTGYNCPIENPLLDKYTDAYNYALWVAGNLTKRNSYESDDRGYPELDVGDNITVDTLFTSDLDATIIASEITYDGAISGHTKYITG